MTDPLLTVQNAAQALGKSERAVYGLIRTGSLPAKRVGNTWRIRKSWLDAMLDSPEPAVTGRR